MAQRWGERWLTVAVLLGVWLLLSFNFPKDSLWYDEALTTYVALDSWDTLWRWCTQIDIQVPFHYIALRGWAGLAGQSEFALRALSALCVVLATAGVMATVRQMAPRSGAAPAAGAIFGLLPGMLWIAYEVRAYAWGLALFTWATAILARWMIRRERWTIPLYGLLMAGALYTHYTALAGFAAHLALIGLIACGMLIRQRWAGVRPILSLVLPLILAGLAFAPWIPVVVARGSADRSFYEGAIPPIQALEVMAGFKALGRQDSPLVAGPFAGAYALLIGLGLLTSQLHRDTRRAGRFAAVWLAVAAGLVVALLTINPKLTGRYFWPAWLGADMLIGLGLALLLRRRSGLALLVAVILCAFPYTTGERGESPNSDFRGMYRAICSEGTPEDVILLRDGTLFPVDRYYGVRAPCSAPRRTFGMPDAPITDVKRFLGLGEAQGVMAEIARLRPPNVWIIAWQGDIMEPQGLSYALLDLTAQHTLPAQMYGDAQLDRYTFGDSAAYERLALLAEAGPLQDADWYNLAPLAGGPTLLALRLIAPADTLRTGDTITLHAWWLRGDVSAPDLRVSAKLTTLDYGWTYTQIDQPPSAWKFYDDRWTPGVPSLGRYELRIGGDVPAGEFAVRYVIYDTQGRFEPVVIVAGQVQVGR